MRCKHLDARTLCFMLCSSISSVCKLYSVNTAGHTHIYQPHHTGLALHSLQNSRPRGVLIVGVATMKGAPLCSATGIPAPGANNLYPEVGMPKQAHRIMSSLRWLSWHHAPARARCGSMGAPLPLGRLGAPVARRHE